MQNRARWAIAAIVLSVLSVSRAHASIEVVGDPVEGNSWSQGWRQVYRYGDPQIDLMAFQVLSPARRFKYQHAIAELEPTGWRQRFASETVAVVDGPPTLPDSRISFRSCFEGDLGTLTLRILAFGVAEQTPYEEIDCTWDGGWSFEDHTGAEIQCLLSRPDFEQMSGGGANVPEPSTLIVWCLLAPLGGCASWWRKLIGCAERKVCLRSPLPLGEG